MGAFDDAVDWGALKDSILGDLAEESTGVLEGADHDINQFLETIAQDTLMAIRAGREDIASEARGQLSAVAELNRIRVSGATFSLLSAILERAANVAIPIVKAAIKVTTGIST